MSTSGTKKVSNLYFSDSIVFLTHFIMTSIQLLVGSINSYVAF